jgi:DNA polymerase-3 subunit epsilon
MKHGALLDAEMLVEIYVELTGGRQHSLSFDVFSDGRETIRVPHPPLTPEGRPLRRLSIFDYEAAAHAEYIKSLGDSAIWFRFDTTRG